LTLLGSQPDAVETFYNLKRHNILSVLFRMLIVLKEKVLSDLKIGVLYMILGFFNTHLGLKRVEKLMRNTEGFEIFSQPNFWEPIFYSPKLPAFLKISAIWFSLRISRQESFTKYFVENYVALARERVNKLKQNLARPDPQGFMRSQCKMLQIISQIILESDQGEFFRKLVSAIPERPYMVVPESCIEKMKSDSAFGKARALVKCANCKTLEKSEKQFKKCACCGFVFYCSKVCQRNDWSNHKQICKQIRKPN